MPNEKIYYEKIRKLLIKQFRHVGECHLWDTSGTLNDKVQKLVSDEAIWFLDSRRRKPDIMGYFKDQKRLVLAEVKDERLKFKEVYQIKQYVDIFWPEFAFLITTKEFNETYHRFLCKRPEILEYMRGQRQIHVCYLRDNELELDSDLTKNDPFLAGMKKLSDVFR